MVLPSCKFNVPSFGPRPAEVEVVRGVVLRKMPVFTPVSVRVMVSTSLVALLVTLTVMVCTVMELVLASASVR